MERLTTNKDVSEMGMYELAHNCCYYKDGEAIYRDFEMETSARDFARNLMTTLCGEDLPINDDEFDEEIMENLQYDSFTNIVGLIALLYRNLWAMADLRESLKEYENAEENGTMCILPYPIGTPIHKVCYSAEINDGFIYSTTMSLKFYADNINDFKEGLIHSDEKAAQQVLLNKINGRVIKNEHDSEFST